MVRKLSVVLTALALIALVPQVQAAQGDWKISITGGLSAPVGDFGKKIAEGGMGAKVGFNIGPSIDYMVTEYLAVGVDGSFTRNSLNTSERDQLRAFIPDPSFKLQYTQIGGGAHLKYWFPMSESPMSVYVLAGAGATNFKVKATSSDPTSAGEDSKTQFTLNGGLGAGYKLNDQVTLGLEGGFKYVKLDENTFAVKSASGFGVKAALTFGISPAGR